MYRYQRKSMLQSALGYCGLGLGLILVLLFAFVRIERQVVIEDRWWSYERRYIYQKTTLVPVTTTTTETVNGKSVTRTSTSLEPRTQTYLRCRGYLVGGELPVRAPDMPCALMPGDSVRDDVQYHAAYHQSESEQREQLTFFAHAWGDFAPGRVIDVKMTLWGLVTEYDVPHSMLAWGGGSNE